MEDWSKVVENYRKKLDDAKQQLNELEPRVKAMEEKKKQRDSLRAKIKQLAPQKQACERLYAEMSELQQKIVTIVPGLKIGKLPDLEALFSSPKLVNSQGDIPKTPVKGERFQASPDKVIYDTKIKLEWFVGPDHDISHYDAEEWVEQLTVAGGKWRLPSIAELQTLYQKGVGKCNINPLFNNSKIYLWVWSSELLDDDKKPSKSRNSPSARCFNFSYGYDDWYYRDFGLGARVFAVRSGRR